MPKSLAKKTLATINAALEEEKSCAISEIILIIQKLASMAFSISVSELSQLIGRDPEITERVISAANTLGFNPSGAPINTIAEAIHVVGFEKIRNLAISLMLAEGAGSSLSIYEQRDTAALAVCSGLLAQQIAEQNDGLCDPEQLFVCASLRNYGKLVMASFMVVDYRKAKILSLDKNPDEAFKEVFGLTPLSLGRTLLLNSTLPRSIMGSFRNVTEDNLKRVATSAQEEIVILSEMAGQLSSTAFDETIGPEDFEDAISEILTKYQVSYPLSLETVNQSFVSVETSLAQLNRALKLPEEASIFNAKLRARIDGEFLPEPPPQSRIAPRKRIRKPKTAQQMSPEEREAFAENSFRKAKTKISTMLIPGNSVDLTELYETVAQSISEGLDLESCLVTTREEFDPDSLSARYGSGPLFERVKNRPIISPRKKDIFSICLARKEDILIQDSKAGKIASIIPEWIQAAGEISSFIILPVKLEQALFSIIVGTVSGDRSIVLENGDLRRLRQMREDLAKAQLMLGKKEIVEA